MHVHVYNQGVRTTIEIKPEHRARLLELAARRGDKGFSNLVSEALDSFLESVDERERRRAIALRLRGCWKPQEAETLRETVARAQQAWH